jgi:hypothetical protein
MDNKTCFGKPHTKLNHIKPPQSTKPSPLRTFAGVYCGMRVHIRTNTIHCVAGQGDASYKQK